MKVVSCSREFFVPDLPRSSARVPPALACNSGIKPLVEGGCPETPKVADLKTRHLAIACHTLQGLLMDSEEGSSFVAIEQAFEMSNYRGLQLVIGEFFG